MSDKLLFAFFACVAIGSSGVHWSGPGDEAAYLASGNGGERAPVRLTNASRTIERGTDGLFHISVLVDGERVDMIIDTGATRSILSRAAVRQRGKAIAAETAAGTIRTLSGQRRFDEARLSRLQVGDTMLSDVPVAIMDTPDDVSLLGGDILRRMGKVTIEGDTITFD